MLVWRMPHTTADIVLTGDERSALESLARTGRGRADLARRARIILRLAAGDLYSNFNESSRTIAKWKQRFLEARIAGLDGRYPGSTATVLTPQLEARILAKTREQPPDGSTQWSTRSLANALKLKTHTYVQRTWERAGLKPHRIERYMRSTDPEFETKAADVIGLYMAPPQHAAVFCLDEKTAIQALDRVDPVLPLSPGRAERHGFEYRRHGTLSLYAALNTQSGDIIGQTAARHTTDDFLTFLREVVATQPATARCISFSTISPRTKPNRSERSWRSIPMCTFTSRRRTRRGSIKLSSGLRRLNATFSRAASSPRWLICGGRS